MMFTTKIKHNEKESTNRTEREKVIGGITKEIPVLSY